MLNILLWKSFIARCMFESLFDKNNQICIQKSSDPITFAGCEIEENEKVFF